MAKALVIDQNLTSTLQINEEEEEKEDSGYDADVTGNKIPEETNTSNSNTGARRGGSRNNAATALKSKASELTLSFEGKVYVFHKVNPEKIWINRCKLCFQYLEGVIYLMAGNAHAA